MNTPRRAANGRTMRVNARRAVGTTVSGAVFVAPADGRWQYLTTTQVGIVLGSWEPDYSPAAYPRDSEGSYSYAGTAPNEYSVQATQVYFDLPTGFAFTGLVDVSIVLVSTQQVVFSRQINQATGFNDGAGASFASPVLPNAHYLVRLARVSGVVGYDGIGIRT